jgi:hypothetical protein
MNGLLNQTFKRTITRQLIDEGYIGDDSLECIFSNRASYKYEIYHSRNYTKCNKTCDFLIRFLYNSNQYNFGEIDSFFEYNNEIFALIYEFDCSAYDFFHDEYYKERGELKEFGQKFFSLYYEIDSLSTSKRVIKCKDILSKCVLIDTVDKKLLVDYLYEREHD